MLTADQPIWSRLFDRSPWPKGSCTVQTEITEITESTEITEITTAGGGQMWWEPADEADVGVSHEVGRLLELYRDHVLAVTEHETERQLVWGVGSAPGPDFGWRYPLVLASYEALAAGGAPIGVGRYAWERLGDLLADFARPVGNLLRSWDLRWDTLIDVTTRPLAAAQVDPTDVVIEQPTQARQATVGLTCTLTGSGDPAFLTAGHLVGANYTKVEAGATGSGALSWVPGEVVHWDDPILAGVTGGYDYAVVRLDDPTNDTVGTLTHAGVQPAPAPPHQPMTIDVYGRMPIPVRRSGSVSGAINQLGDTTRQWLNCWEFLSLPPLQPGDSGSVALGSSGQSLHRVFGHFVGMSALVGHSIAHQYVQDLGSCLAAGLDQHITI